MTPQYLGPRRPCSTTGCVLRGLFQQSLIVVGGEGARALDLLLEPLQETLQMHCFDNFYADLRVVVDPWGDDAWARGAASLMLDELFRPTYTATTRLARRCCR